MFTAQHRVRDEKTRRASTTRRAALLLVSAAALSLAGLTLPSAVSPLGAEPAHASAQDGFTTGGSDRFKDQIQWVAWPTDNADNIVLGYGRKQTGVDYQHDSEPILNGAYYAKSGATTMRRDLGDGGALVTTCTLSNPDHSMNDGGKNRDTSLLQAYLPGGWAGDGLDDLYNVGGTGRWTTNDANPAFPTQYANDNQLSIGLRNDADHANVSFDYS